MTNGYVAALLALIVAVITTLVMNRFLIGYSSLVCEPIAQGVGFFLAWLAVWPWMRRQPGFTSPARGLVGMVKRAGFMGYASWIAVGFAVLTAARLYFRLG